MATIDVDAEMAELIKLASVLRQQMDDMDGAADPDEVAEFERRAARLRQHLPLWGKRHRGNITPALAALDQMVADLRRRGVDF